MSKDRSTAPAPDALALAGLDAVEAEQAPNLASLRLKNLQDIRTQLLTLVLHPERAGENRPDIYRSLLPTGLRRFIGESHPEMASEVALAALELEPDEQAAWMSDVLTAGNLHRLANFGGVERIGTLAFTLSMSTLRPSKRKEMLERLLDPANSSACERVADSGNPNAISATTYAMAHCLPMGSAKWKKTFQNVLLSDDCVKAVTESNEEEFLMRTVLAAEQLPDELRRAEVLQAISAVLQALEHVPPWQRFLDARSDPPTPLRERTPSPRGL